MAKVTEQDLQRIEKLLNSEDDMEEVFYTLVTDTVPYLIAEIRRIRALSDYYRTEIEPWIRYTSGEPNG